MMSDQVDPHTVSPARRWNYWLGGKDHFQVDRDSGDRIAAAYPAVRTTAREGRAFHQRAVRFLAAEAGIRQFLDIGTGLPAPDNTHEVAQAVAPDAKVVYVDNDPMVLAHARALMIGGATTYVDADLRDPGKILAAPEVRELLDPDRPVGILLISVLHFLTGDDQARAVVRELLAAAPPGSYLVATHATMDFVSPEHAAMYHAMYQAGQVDALARDRAAVARFFDGLALVEPGLVAACDWRPEQAERPTPAEVALYAGVARK
ncbi:hypothetical protein GCM10010168_52490 [Actinoplanes ianthinogenes]|uniref:S-adenosyl methyltransferase n=2 Tax=Actinoplanes ianthinogenes TaxID=122358 RepID=A0ABM7M413_9ACTN|nr:hypothetical protein Aiant_69550 [Actinoplanes ianthinogenes]GGR27672.1 hypothetical protein GCM10010168_52490 [Actinoplanes ianthinogenes]